MLKIFNERVYGIDESIIASGYPMRADEITEWDKDDFDFDPTDFKRATNLGTVPTGTGHDNFLKGVIVQMDVRYPNYWSPQFQRYSFHDIVSSNSKMHRLTKMDIKKCCNEYVDDIVLENLQKWIGLYNGFTKDDIYVSYMGGVWTYISKTSDETAIPRGATLYTKYQLFMKVISNAPLGFEQTMRVSTNYLQLKTIYLQRKHHKLKEDWGNFCEWVEQLPYFKEWCLKDVK